MLPHISASSIKLCIFDLDGVLVSSKDLHYEALNAALAEIGPQFVITRAEHEATYDGLSTKQKLAMLTERKGLPHGEHAKVWDRKQALTVQMVATHIPEDRRLQRVFEELKAAGYPICVASNCIAASVSALLAAIGLVADATLSNEDVSHPKPAPDIYLRACELFGVMPNQAVVCEDSEHGRRAALDAGCHLIEIDDPKDVTVERIASHLS